MKLGGPLYRACTTGQKLWYVVEITGDPDDPRRSSRISLQHAREQIEQYGRDNPWVLVNVFGQFPPSSLNALIGPDEVREAQKRFYREYEIGAAAKVIGVDVAQFRRRKGGHCEEAGDTDVALPPCAQRRFDDWRGLVAKRRTSGALTRRSSTTRAALARRGWIDQMRALGPKPIGNTLRL